MVRERTRSEASGRTLISPAVEPADLSLAARSHATVLVTAGSSADRARCARAIHRRGVRCRGPFVAVSCRPRGRRDGPDGSGRGEPDDAGLLQASYERAGGGTLFIDGVAAMSPPAQARLFGLLGALAGPLGEPDADSITSGVRVIADGTAALEAALAAGRFSRPLFYRMNVIHLRLDRVPAGRRPAAAVSGSLRRPDVPAATAVGQASAPARARTRS